MSSGPNIIRDGLIFHYDLSDSKSFAGEPTTNYIYHQNPRIDGTYTSYVPESNQGNIDVNHPQAIRVYNIDNNDISYYLNTGISVGNSGVAWEYARHAYWIYDNDLKKPVVQMYDTIGTWQAKYLGSNMSAWNTYGMTVGSQYTISWLQWTTSTSKYANVGLYTQDSSSSNNFWDGLSSGSATSINTRTHTWERVYQTYTVSGSRDLNNASATVYFYNGGASSNFLRIADVQLELKDHPTKFSPTLTRSTTSSLIDRTRTITSIDVSNISFNSAGKIVFDGTNDNISLNSSLGNFGTTNWTINCWWKSSGTQSDYTSIIGQGFIYPISTGGWCFKVKNSSGENYLSFSYATGNELITNVVTSVTPNDGSWHNLTATRKDTTITMYMDGVSVGSFSVNAGYSFGTGATTYIGYTPRDNAYLNGNLDVLQVYNRGLTASEVSQNYNSLRKKFGV